MKKKLVTIILIAIVLLGSILRIWQLGSIPISPDWDEASLAYTAQSLIETGKDEYGESYPPVFRSFDDYKPGVYVYLAIPFIKAFGLNTFAIRLPSAMMGVIAILALYYLAKELFASKPAQRRYAEITALLSAFLLAISPWHLQFSRVAFETNVGLTLNILAALFFIKGLNKPWMFILSAFFAGLNLSVYQSERVFTPLLILALSIIYRKELMKLSKKILAGAVVVGILTILPFVGYLAGHPQALDRIQATSMFSQSSELLKENIMRVYDDNESNNYIGQMIDNRRLVFAKEIASGYLAHFDPNWLFVTGDSNNNRHHAPRMGLLYILTLPFILVGIYQLLFAKFDKRIKYVLFSWFLIAPIPASITIEVPHAVRTLNMLPMYLIFTAIGLVTVFTSILKYKRASLLFFVVLLIAALFNFSYFINQYFVQQNYFHAYDWQYGYERTVKEVSSMKKDYKKIIVSDKQPMDRSYIFFLFYLDYSPQEYQNTRKRLERTAKHPMFDTYEFRRFTWDEEKNKKDVLLVGPPDEFPDAVATRKVIDYPNGKPAILIVDPEDNL